MVKVSFTGKVKLEQRLERSEGTGPAARGDRAFPAEGTTGHRAGECQTFFKEYQEGQCSWRRQNERNNQRREHRSN